MNRVTNPITQSLMKRLAVLVVMLMVHGPSFATWSIILIDPNTGEIGIAGASCTYQCYGIGSIVPGRGAIIVQANSNYQAHQRGLSLLKAGQSPQQIMAALRAPQFDPEHQQYAVISLRHPNRPMTYTGRLTTFHKGDLTGNGVCVQSNTLASSFALQTMMDAVTKGRQKSLPLNELLMLALKAGSQAGGDKRCGTQRATSAFIMVARPNDKPDRLYLDLNLYGERLGGANNAVDLLGVVYNKWKQKTQQRR